MKRPDNVAEQRGKLASYEVAGVGEQNKFVLQGTVDCVFSVVPSGRNNFRTGSSHFVAG